MKAPNLPAGALDAVEVAKRCLLDAVYRLDEHGLECVSLNEVQAETAAICSVWSGRRPPDESADLPACFAEVAREWRRRHGRSY